MIIRNTTLSLIYKCLLIVLSLAGLYLNSGLPAGRFNPGVLAFYTIQSNILCLVFTVIAIVYGLRHRGELPDGFSYMPRLKAAVVFAITVTMLIYHFVLVPAQSWAQNATAETSPANILVHYIVPLMFIGDWILFDRKGYIGLFDPMLWLLIPYAYFIFAMIRAQFGDLPGFGTAYPYDFINIDHYGVGRVLMNVVRITLVFIPVGYLYYGIDRLMKNRKKTLYF